MPHAAGIPTRRVTVEVIQPFKGTASAGARLTLFQTGGTVNLPPAPAKGEKGEAAPEVKVHQVILEGDPLYRALDKRPGGAGRPRSAATWSREAALVS